MTKLYGITGKMRSGKDTFYALASAAMPSLRFAFGDSLKAECASACGITVDEINENKPLYRTLLQWWGTEFRRGQDTEYWIKKMAKKLSKAGDGAIFITDVRFKNEADFIKQFGGKIIRVVRPNNAAPNANAGHASETEMDAEVADFTISAESIDELGEKVADWVNGQT